MARYDYECLNCGWAGELLGISPLKCDEQRCRQKNVHHADPEAECGGELKRSEEIPLPNIDPKGSFQTGAITSRGQLIPGRFGASSGKVKKGYNKA